MPFLKLLITFWYEYKTLKSLFFSFFNLHIKSLFLTYFFSSFLNLLITWIFSFSNFIISPSNSCCSFNNISQLVCNISINFTIFISGRDWTSSSVTSPKIKLSKFGWITLKSLAFFNWCKFIFIILRHLRVFFVFGLIMVWLL